MSMAPHEFCHPLRVEEVRPQDRLQSLSPEAAPSAPVATDDGLPLTAGLATPAPAPAR
jgi:hypothetical protein